MTRIGCLLCLAALASFALFAPAGAGAKTSGSAAAPSIEGLGASQIGEAKATIAASISADGAKTKYQVWVAYAPCQGGAGECAKPFQEEELVRGSVMARDTREIERALSGLTGGCSYSFWFVASNSQGTVESEHASFETPGPAGPKACRR
jgi:hypothetical protein